jgi:O-acetyl-ADP-ribose deacetylase (regulator of RNase III)
LNSLKLAQKHNLKSIAFPAISTGIYGYPKDLASIVVNRTIDDFITKDTGITDIYLVEYS